MRSCFAAMISTLTALVAGHINELCARAVKNGVDVFNVLQAACINPVEHYKLDVGLLQEGNAADFILVNDLERFEVLRTYIDGELVAENGVSNISKQTPSGIINNFTGKERIAADFVYAANSANEDTWVIEAIDGQLITNKLMVKMLTQKMVSQSRYR